MAKSRYHVGLEIGTSTTRVAVAEIKPDLSVKILGIGETKSAGIRKGEIVDLNHARSCVKSTILEAEDISHIRVGGVFLALTGSHIHGMNNTGRIELSSEGAVVTEDHVREVEDMSSDANIGKDQSFIHTLMRQYKLDGEVHRLESPAGFMGKTLEAESHLIFGIHTKFQNSMRLVAENSLEVDDIVFSPIASAQVVLNRENKDDGALVVDIGAGTTDYILYIDGLIYASGCIAIGGDHITNDIHLVTQVPMASAEQVKVDHGDVTGSTESHHGSIKVETELGHDIPDIDRKTLNLVIEARLQELFGVLAKRLPEGILDEVGAGIFLTGGVSQTPGIERVVKDIFSLEVTTPKKGDVNKMNYADNYKKGPLGWLTKIFS